MAVTVLVTAAVMSLWYQLVTSNFQIQYVASSSNQAMPWYYKAGALWGGQEGSLLFWCWILTLFSMVTVLVHRKRNPVLMPYVVGVVAMVTTFFLLVNNFVANPFDAIGVSQAGEAPVPWTPPDGQGLNPLLQYWAMVIHPPILYVGYVGFTIPFAFAIAALITRELDEDWIRTTRRWMMIPWLFLGTGVLLGAMWAYVVLGWGRLLGVGPGGKRLPHALVDRDGVPALGHHAGAQGDDEGLEHGPDPGHLPAVHSRHLSHSQRDRVLGPLFCPVSDRSFLLFFSHPDDRPVALLPLHPNG